jgi:YggT family protein
MHFLGTYGRFVVSLRVAMLWVGVTVALLALIDWAVRTRRINPFSRVARFFRRRIDPLLVPIERILVRNGGRPAAAAWWGLFAFVVFAILLIYLAEFVGQLLFQVVAMTREPGEAWRVLLSWAVSLLSLALLVRVLSSWLPVSPYSRWIRWSYVLTNWMIRPLQRVIPRLGMLDVTPLVAWFLLRLAGTVILG